MKSEANSGFPVGRQPIILTNFSQKLHENEENLLSKLYHADPPLKIHHPGVCFGCTGTTISWL